MLDALSHMFDMSSPRPPLLLLLLQSLVADFGRASYSEDDGSDVTPTMQLNFHPTTCKADFGDYTPREPRPGRDSAADGDTPWAEVSSQCGIHVRAL